MQLRIAQQQQPEYNRRTRLAKPQKPYPGFPLFAHANGQWVKKIRGRHHCFGTWDDPLGARDRYLDQRDYLEAGRLPPAIAGQPTIENLITAFRQSRESKLRGGNLSRRSLADYRSACQLLAKHVGKRIALEDLQPVDFLELRSAIEEGREPVTVKNVLQRIRTVLRYAQKASLIDRPVRYGESLDPPSAKMLRRAKHARGVMTWQAAEIRRLVYAAQASGQPQIAAMILLGINCALGNADVGRLEFRNLDLRGGWLNYPRPKTEVRRRAQLWPETIGAIQAALEARPHPASSVVAECVFLTRRGECWSKDSSASPLTARFALLADEASVPRGKSQRKGLGFYALRHTFRTIADSCLDQPAVDLVMGHAAATTNQITGEIPSRMAANYRQRIEDERLARVAAHVRAWLFPWS